MVENCRPLHLTIAVDNREAWDLSLNNRSFKYARVILESLLEGNLYKFN